MKYIIQKMVDADGTSLRRGKIKQLLLELGFKKIRCEGVGCKVRGTWNGKPVVLHLEHKDGNCKNNKFLNLALLCPNCHSQTETYCRTLKSRKRKK